MRKRIPVDTALAVLETEDVDDAELLTELAAPGLRDELPEDLQDYLDWENEDQRNYVKHTMAVTQRMAETLGRLTPSKRKVAILAAKNLTTTYKEMAERTNLSPATVSEYIRNDPQVRLYLALHQRRAELIAAPKQAERLEMAWRIAQRNELPNPKVALQALDLIAKQTGELSNDTAPQLPTIVLASFALPTTTAQPTTAGEVIEGEFTPIEVDLPPK